jgi:hypothetical protein
MVLPNISVVDTTNVKAVVSMIYNFSSTVMTPLRRSTRPKAMAPRMRPA